MRTKRTSLPQKAKLGYFVLKQDAATGRSVLEQYRGFLYHGALRLRDAVVVPNKKPGRFTVTGLDGTAFELTAESSVEAMQYVGLPRTHGVQARFAYTCAYLLQPQTQLQLQPHPQPQSCLFLYSNVPAADLPGFALPAADGCWHCSRRP